MTTLTAIVHAAQDTLRDDLLLKFANHQDSCHCFICRTLTAEEREELQRLRKERVAP
jgi:hypothetical protein